MPFRFRCAWCAPTAATRSQAGGVHRRSSPGVRVGTGDERAVGIAVARAAGHRVQIEPTVQLCSRTGLTLVRCNRCHGSSRRTRWPGGYRRAGRHGTRCRRASRPGPSVIVAVAPFLNAPWQYVLAQLAPSQVGAGVTPPQLEFFAARRRRRRPCRSRGSCRPAAALAVEWHSAQASGAARKEAWFTCAAWAPTPRAVNVRVALRVDGRRRLHVRVRTGERDTVRVTVTRRTGQGAHVHVAVHVGGGVHARRGCSPRDSCRRPCSRRAAPAAGWRDSCHTSPASHPPSSRPAHSPVPPDEVAVTVGVAAGGAGHDEVRLGAPLRRRARPRRSSTCRSSA